MIRILFLFFLFLPILIQAQIQRKGSWMVGGGMNATFSDTYLVSARAEQTSKNVQIIPRIGYFVADKLAVGGAFSFSDNQFFTQDLVGRTENLTRVVGFAPFVRPYLLQRQVGIFTELTGTLEFFRFQPNPISSFFESNPTEANFKINAGVGIDFYLGKNAALELLFRYNLQGDNSQPFISTPSSKVSFNLGIQLFLNEWSSRETNLVARYLKKGNYVFSGQAQFNPKASGIPSSFSIAPQFSYFVLNKWQVGGNVDYNFLKFEDSFKSKQWATGIFTRHFIQLSEKVFFVPRFDITYTRTIWDYTRTIFSGGFPLVETVGANSNGLSLNPSVGILYFLNSNVVVDAGLSFSYITSWGREREEQGNVDVIYGSDVHTLKWEAGLEYFLLDNISVRMGTNYEVVNLESTSDRVGASKTYSNNLRLNLTWKYFLHRIK